MAATVQDIVYAFLQTYYQRMKNNPSKLSSLYVNTAELTHINYQQINFDKEELIDDILPTIKLAGRENISKFFIRNEKKVNDLKIKIDSCESQTTGLAHKGIFLVVTGELFWSNAPVFKFCQTFILTPAPRNSEIYEISNDIIRFIPDTLKQIEILIQQPNGEVTKEISRSTEKIENKTSQVKDVIINNKDEKKSEPTVSHPIKKTKSTTKLTQENIEEKENVTELKSVDDKEEKIDDHKIKDEKAKEKKYSKHTEKSKEVKENHKTESKKLKSKPIPSTENISDDEQVPEKLESETEHNETKKEKVVEKENTELEENSEETKENQEPESEIANENENSIPIKMTWASKLASNGTVPKESRKMIVPRDEPATGKNETSGRTKKNNKDNKEKESEKKLDTTSRKENGSGRNRKKGNFSNVNKEGYYPIYINGAGSLKDDVLKNRLVKEFGPVMKITSGDNFAVVDFQLQSSQTEAIEKKKIAIDDVEISLERKTTKKPTSSTQSNFSNIQRGHKKDNIEKRKGQVSVE